MQRKGEDDGFNRTFMELKWKMQWMDEEKMKRFNRTFMELKWMDNSRSIDRNKF